VTSRRTFLAAFGGGILAAPLAAEAQQAGKLYRVGILSGGSPDKDSSGIEAFRNGLRELGWVEGRNVAIERRSAEGRTDRLTGLAAELVRLKVDVIVTAASTPATLAAKRATTTTPVVVVAVGAPLETALVDSLARPGGNVTGSTTLGGEVASKRLDFAKELVPPAAQVALLWNPDNPANARLYRELVQKAQQANLKLLSVEVRDVKEFDASITTSLAASSSSSCCAERISASTISIASSFRHSNPATRYQQLVARSWGSISFKR